MCVDDSSRVLPADAQSDESYVEAIHALIRIKLRYAIVALRAEGDPQYARIHVLDTSRVQAAALSSNRHSRNRPPRCGFQHKQVGARGQCRHIEPYPMHSGCIPCIMEECDSASQGVVQ